MLINTRQTRHAKHAAYFQRKHASVWRRQQRPSMSRSSGIHLFLLWIKIDQSVLARPSPRVKVQVGLQHFRDVGRSFVRAQESGVDRARVPRLDKRNIPDGSCFKQVLRYPRLWIKEPHPAGVSGVGQRRHYLRGEQGRQSTVV